MSPKCEARNFEVCIMFVTVCRFDGGCWNVKNPQPSPDLNFHTWMLSSGPWVSNCPATANFADRNWLTAWSHPQDACRALSNITHSSATVPLWEAVSGTRDRERRPSDAGKMSWGQVRAVNPSRWNNFSSKDILKAVSASQVGRMTRSRRRAKT